jgi:predicted phosphoadenosine phosphosulfate sulfurtransferase
MGKRYIGKNVFEACMDRLDYIFSKFDHVIVAFSGGKDSGLLVELVNLFYVRNAPSAQVSVYHIDYEGDYQHTIDYVDRCMGKYPYFDYYHLCMPISASCGVSMYQSTWMPWNPEEKDIWIRDLPEKAICLDNHSFDFFEVGMSDYVFQTKFGKWLHKVKGAKRTAVLVGIRTQESLNRYHAVTRSNTYRMFGKVPYSTRVAMNIFNFYPLYDWLVEDVWTANAHFGFDYNKLYNLYYMAGVPVGEMRVANPFHDCGVESLKLYRIIEPNTWSKLIGRVNGANFGAIYGGTKAMGYKDISLPAGHTWKSYANFLLRSLPAKTRNIYLKKFRASLNYWLIKGGALPITVIQDLSKAGYEFENLGRPANKRKYKSDHEIVRFFDYLDEVNIKDFRLIPSYKRMCITILKNDTSCRYMGFGQTKDELQKQKEAADLWTNLL